MISKLDKYIKLIDKYLSPGLIILIPIFYCLYLLNIHGIIIPKNILIFRLDLLYRNLLGILIFLYIYKLLKKEAYITKSDIFLFIFMFFTIISVFTSIDINTSLIGYRGRHEGLYTLLFYCFLYLDCKTINENINHLLYIKLILFYSIINYIICLLQLSGLFSKVIYLYRSNNIIGLTENSNFLGSLMCLFSTLSISLYLLYDKKIYFYILFIFSYMCLLLSNTTGAFISFIFVFIIYIVFLFIKKKVNYKKLLISIITIISIYSLILNNRGDITSEIKYTFNTLIKIVNPSKENKIEEYNKEVLHLGNGRIRIWKTVFKLIKQKPLLGYGPDNLVYVYKSAAIGSDFQDKAHNVYLHIWVSSGLFAFLSFLIWNIYIIILGIKSNNILSNILAISVLSYSIQSLFNINVIEVTPYFYIIAAFMMNIVNEKIIKQISC